MARLHLDALGVELTVLSKEQADYIGVSVEGPFKPAHYRYDPPPPATATATATARIHTCAGPTSRTHILSFLFFLPCLLQLLSVSCGGRLVVAVWGGGPVHRVGRRLFVWGTICAASLPRDQVRALAPSVGRGGVVSSQAVPGAGGDG